MGWGKGGALEAIRDLNRLAVTVERSQPPTACPYDGNPLKTGPNNVLYCDMGDYEWPRDGKPLGP